MKQVLPINQMIPGNCLKVLKTFPDNSIDSIVTDPPAGISFMGEEWDTFDHSMFGKKGEEGKNDLKVKKNFEILPRYANADLIGFQNFICEVFSEVIRILKPGGHALVWAIPKTSHHTAMGLERAGFEIRDCVYHIFGSGFPKSLNIGKAVDKLQGNKRKVIGKNSDFSIDGAKRNGSKHQTVKEVGERIGHKYGFGSAWNSEVSIGITQFEGLGTALKPAVECWWLCRKPISEKTIVDNVLKYGTGGLDIDNCRIKHNEKTIKTNRQKNKGQSWDKNNCGLRKNPTNIASADSKGRFPSHLILDDSDEVQKAFPQQKSVRSQRGNGIGKGFHGSNAKYNTVRGFNDFGSAARFFYTAKAGKRERNIGLQNTKSQRHADRKKADGAGGDNPRNRTNKSKKNFHPTVKPISLMKYLIKLITPKDGIILDCFAGSGSTLIAAIKLHRKWIGIEIDKKYCKIANKRIKKAQEKIGLGIFV